MRACGKNIEPIRVVAWAKTITNECRERFDLGRVCFEDVSFSLNFLTKFDTTYDSSRMHGEVWWEYVKGGVHKTAIGIRTQWISLRGKELYMSGGLKQCVDVGILSLC